MQKTVHEKNASKNNRVYSQSKEQNEYLVQHVASMG